jgi:hypothetical protein
MWLPLSFHSFFVEWSEPSTLTIEFFGNSFIEVQATCAQFSHLKLELRASGVAQVVEYLPRKPKVLSSNPSTPPPQKKLKLSIFTMLIHLCHNQF